MFGSVCWTAGYWASQLKASTAARSSAPLFISRGLIVLPSESTGFDTHQKSIEECGSCALFVAASDECGQQAGIMGLLDAEQRSWGAPHDIGRLLVPVFVVSRTLAGCRLSTAHGLEPGNRYRNIYPRSSLVHQG